MPATATKRCVLVEQLLNLRRGRVVVARPLRHDDIRLPAGREDHRRKRRPVLAAARQPLLARIGERACDRGVGPALSVGVVDVGAERRAALGVPPRAALLAAHVEEVRVDRDRRLTERLPRLQRRVDLGRLPQPFAGARPCVTLAPRLGALMAVDQQSRMQPAGGALDRHQVAAVVHLVPAAAGVEHRRRVAVAEVVDEVGPPGVGDGAREQRATVGLGPAVRLPSSPAQHTASARRRTATKRRHSAAGVGTVALSAKLSESRTTLITPTSQSTSVTAPSRLRIGVTVA